MKNFSDCNCQKMSGQVNELKPSVVSDNFFSKTNSLKPNYNTLSKL